MRNAEQAALLRRIGRRLRWLREAWEKRDPNQHSQAQWAEALGITPEMLCRIEAGRQLASPHILLRLIVFGGVSADYVWLGVVSGEVMQDWLLQSLLADHGDELAPPSRYQEILARTYETTISHRVREIVRLQETPPRRRRRKNSARSHTPV